MRKLVTPTFFLGMCFFISFFEINAFEDSLLANSSHSQLVKELQNPIYIPNGSALDAQIAPINNIEKNLTSSHKIIERIALLSSQLSNQSNDSDGDGLNDSEDPYPADSNRPFYYGRWYQYYDDSGVSWLDDGSAQAGSVFQYALNNGFFEDVTMESAIIFDSAGNIIASTTDPTLLGDDGTLSNAEWVNLTVTSQSNRPGPIYFRYTYYNPDDDHLSLSEYDYVEIFQLEFSSSGASWSATYALDTDRDGVDNNIDTDDDGDGILDVNDLYPLDATRSSDGDPTQSITGSLDVSELSLGETTNLSVGYHATDSELNDALTTGLGLRLHYDSSVLQVDAFTERLFTGSQPFQFKDDTSDLDNDPNTDKYYLTSWADTSGTGWPVDGNTGEALAQPLTLYTVPITAIGDFNGTTLNFSASSTPVGFSFVSQKIEVPISQAPVINVPSDITVAAENASGTKATNSSIVAFLEATTATDNVDGSVSVANDAPDIFPLGSTDVTFTAQDTSGNTASAIGTVTVIDQTPPVINKPLPITISVITGNFVPISDSRLISFLSFASATDNVDGSIEVSNDAPNEFQVGATLVTFTAVDSAGLSSSESVAVTVVVDQSKPIITLIGDQSITIEQTLEYQDLGATAMDDIDGDITSNIEVQTNVNSNVIGNYSVIFNVKDAAGNSADTVVRSVTVITNDTDSDGISNSQDNCPLIQNPNQINTDGDQYGDLCDTDDDNDGVIDQADAFPLDASESLDADSDGIGNNSDNCILTINIDQIDTDLDGIGDVCDNDDDGDGVLDTEDAFPLDSTESVDSDNDGTGNNSDNDDDGDGVLDTEDAFPLDSTESLDTDLDGVGNNQDLDDDGDRVLDDEDAFPLDATESVDTDNDGIGNNADNDDDNDGVEDANDEFPLDPSEWYDTDGDGVGNNADNDDDNDGILDAQDDFPLINTEASDNDNNGIGDNQDRRMRLLDKNILANKMIVYAGSVATSFVEDIEDSFAGDSDNWTLARGDSVNASVACENGGGYDAVITRTDWRVITLNINAENCIDLNNFTTNGVAVLVYDDAHWEQGTPRIAHPFTFSFSNLQIAGSTGTSFRYTGELKCDSHYNSISESFTYKTEGENLIYEAQWGSIYDELPDATWNVNNSLISDENGKTNFHTETFITNCDFKNIQVVQGAETHEIIDIQYVSEYGGSGYMISEYTREEKIVQAQNKEVYERQIYTPESGWQVPVWNKYSTRPSMSISGDGNYALNVYSTIVPTYQWARREAVDNIIFQEVDQWTEFEWIYLDEENNKLSANYNREAETFGATTFPWDLENDGINESYSTPHVWSRFHSTAESLCYFIRYLVDDIYGFIKVVSERSAGADLFFPCDGMPIDGYDVVADYYWYQDINLDGLNEHFTLDDDNDGFEDSIDAFQFDPNEWSDTDFDGVGDNADAFPYDPLETLDSDNDGIGDNADVFPFDSTESSDFDGDGIGDNADKDDDNDGVLDSVDAFPLNSAESIDSDGDGIGNNADSDDDNDGYDDTIDVFPLDPLEHLDTDRDGVGNNADTDDDGDQVPDQLELANGTDPLLADSDYDGVSDYYDAFPLNPYESVDSDGDGIGNNVDSDDDNDGVLDPEDAFPLDPSESLDSDGDGVGDNSDAFPNDANESTDTDGDGVGDNSDAFPNDASETTDTDADGVGDNSDAFPNNSEYTKDTDSDGMPDAWELRYGLDPNDPSDASSDRDNDGYTALEEFINGTIPSGSIDIDGNERYDALTDGLLILRSMFGLDGSSLTAGTAASDAVFSDSDELISRINTLGDLADIDGSGDIDALTDGLLILRYLFGLEGETLVAGVVSGDATRTTEEIEAHLNMLMP